MGARDSGAMSMSTIWTRSLSRREALRRLGAGGLAASFALREPWARPAHAQTPGATPAGATPAAPADVPIDHVIVIYLENHTFDNLYGTFPGANGLDAPGARIVQVDRD